jgi:hypothetical protein
MAMSRVAVDGGTTWDMPCCSRMILKVLPPPNWSARSPRRYYGVADHDPRRERLLEESDGSRAASNSAVSSDVGLSGSPGR